jgi:hypothetical protein
VIAIAFAPLVFDYLIGTIHDHPLIAKTGRHGCGDRRGKTGEHGETLRARTSGETLAIAARAFAPHGIRARKTARQSVELSIAAH